MMTKKLFHVSLLLVLAGSLLLFAGCRENLEQPSHGIETSTVTELQPSPAVTPGEPGYPPNPDPPEAVDLFVDTGAFTITNAEGQTLTYDGEFSGTMDILQLNGITEVVTNSPEMTMWVPYSDHFTYERPEALGENEPWHIAVASFPNDKFRQYFAADGGGLGGGGAERVEYDASGSLLVRGKPGDGMVGLALGLPDSSVLDKSGWRNGWVKFIAMIGEQGEIRLEGRGDTVRFSGLDPKQRVNVTYGPDYTSGSVLEVGTGLDLEVGSGTLDLSQVAEGQITIQEDGREARVLGKAE